MPNAIQSSEGYASVQYKLILGQKRSLSFDAQVVTFVSAEIKDNVYGVGTAMHTFRTLDPQFLESIKQAMSNADPLLEFRLGFGPPTDVYWLPWQRHIIVKYYAKFEGIATAAGHLLVFESANALTRMKRSNKTLAHKGTISSMVATIAAENGLESVVEATDGKFILYQTFLDDTRFIQERLLGRAIRRGRGGYYFFIRDNVVHFHTADYQTSARQMNYYNIFGRSLAVNDRSQDPKLWDAGVAGVRMIAHDPYTGQTQEIENNPDKALRLADSIYDFANITNGQWNILYHLSQNPPVEVNALAQHQYQIARQQTFHTTVSVDKMIMLRHGDLLNFSITQQNAKASSHSGYYLITGAFHSVKKQAVVSTYTLERGEVRGQDQSLTVQNTQEQLIPTSKAPGEDPNILEIQSSEQTKGAGKQSSATTYSVVTDVNGLPKT